MICLSATKLTEIANWILLSHCSQLEKGNGSPKVSQIRNKDLKMKWFKAVTLHRIFLFWLRFGVFFCNWCLCVFQKFVSKIKGGFSLPSWLVNCQMSQITYKCTILLSWFSSREYFHCDCFCFWLAVINMHTYHYYCYCLLPASNITIGNLSSVKKWEWISLWICQCGSQSGQRVDVEWHYKQLLHKT